MGSSLVRLEKSEEVTLRRVALGIVSRRDLPKSDVDRLLELGLVEDVRKRLVLSDSGRTEYARLPKLVALRDHDDMGELASVLKNQLQTRTTP